MTTCPVRIEFYCGDAEQLKFTHNISCCLVGPEAQAARRDAGYVKRFTSVIMPIMKEHEEACRRASGLLCEICGSFSTGVLQSPMSWLHQVGDPFVGVWVNSVCGNSRCETQMRQEVQETMGEVIGEHQGQQELESVEVLRCRVCGKTEEMMRCARCKVVGYCGREHQKEDWKVHKRSCVSKDGKGG
jgi:hypothetical protein